MQRLNTVLPDWTRVQWTNIENKEKYEPKIQNIVNGWQHIERMSVAHGVRSSTLDIINSDELLPLTNEYKQYNVFVVPLAREGTTTSYSSTSPKYIPGKPYRVRVVFTKSEELAKEWYDLWNTAPLNNRRVGELLGYPPCCIDFYTKYWVDQKFVDTSWVMAADKLTLSDADRIIHIKEDTPPECNILWRWQGVRLVSHLPCSFDCEHTVNLGMKNAELGRLLGYTNEIDTMYELLSWPVEWSAKRS